MMCLRCRQYLLAIVLVVAVTSTKVLSAPAHARAPRDSAVENDKDSSKGKDLEGQQKKEESVHVLFEGDIMLTNEQIMALPSDESSTEEPNVVVREKRSLSPGTPSPGKAIHQTWVNGVVPYFMSGLLDGRYRMYFNEAIKIIEDATCIRFIHRTEQENYLFFDKDEEECKSYVGCLGGPQVVTLAEGCASTGHALHELGHALGLWHEHSRPDRDDYIEVLYENLRSEEDKRHFKTISNDIFKSVPDVGYDLESVMHYSPFAFARQTDRYDLRTIKIRENCSLEELQCENLLPMGQREVLSYKDMKRLNELYQCTDVPVRERVCVIPTPTPTIVTTEETISTTVVIPTPTSTLTPSPLDRRLRTRNQVSLKLIEDHNGSTIVDRHGIQCEPSPGCTPVPCIGSTCESIPNRFQIIKTSEEDGTSIRSGNTVVLRSIDDYSHFLDCSDPTRCMVSECREDNDIEDLNNASYVSSCASHKFEIWGVNRRRTKILNTQNKIQFRKPNTDNTRHGVDYFYLSCNGKWCHLKANGDCPLNSKPKIFSSSQNPITGLCPVDSFNLTKLVE